MLDIHPREQLWENLKEKWQSLPVDRAAWRWRPQSASFKKGAYVFITGREQEALDEAVKQIGKNVTGVRGDAANLDDLDRLFDTVKREKGKIDILFASAGKGEAALLGEITEQHFDKEFGLIVRGTLFTAQKALPLINDGGSIIMIGSVASVKGFPGFGVYAVKQGGIALLRAHLVIVEPEGQEDSRKRV